MRRIWESGRLRLQVESRWCGRTAPQLVRMLKNVPGIEKVTLATIGLTLEQYLGELLDAGLDAVNISLDTLDPGLYETITGADALDTVLGDHKQGRQASHSGEG